MERALGRTTALRRLRAAAAAGCCRARGSGHCVIYVHPSRIVPVHVYEKKALVRFGNLAWSLSVDFTVWGLRVIVCGWVV